VRLSLLCGVLNFVAQCLLLFSFNEAIKTNANLAIASTMLSGCIVWGLFGSRCIYDETITCLQLVGSILLITGNATLAFMSPNPSGSDAVVTEGGTFLVSFYAFMAMCLLGSRVVISKTCTETLGTVTYIELNFWVDFALGLGMLLFWACGWLSMSFEWERSLALAGATVLVIFAEYFLFQGILLGVVGVVVATVASNFVLVAFLSTLLNGSSLSAP
jgi:hypothetical protein